MKWETGKLSQLLLRRHTTHIRYSISLLVFFVSIHLVANLVILFCCCWLVLKIALKWFLKSCFHGPGICSLWSNIRLNVLLGGMAFSNGLPFEDLAPVPVPAAVAFCIHSSHQFVFCSWSFFIAFFLFKIFHLKDDAPFTGVNWMLGLLFSNIFPFSQLSVCLSLGLSIQLSCQIISSFIVCHYKS